MKNLFLGFVLTVVSFSFVNAQTVNDVPIADIDVEYVQIVGTAKLVGNKVTIELDFGQQGSFWTNSGTVIKDANGKQMTFNSMIDALNFMATTGYEVVQAYAISTGSVNVYHYLLKKSK